MSNNLPKLSQDFRFVVQEILFPAVEDLSGSRSEAANVVSKAKKASDMTGDRFRENKRIAHRPDNDCWAPPPRVVPGDNHLRTNMLLSQGLTIARARKVHETLKCISSRVATTITTVPPPQLRNRPNKERGVHFGNPLRVCKHH